MLSRTPFLTADELGLTKAYYGGLVEVLRRLEHKLFRHVVGIEHLRTHTGFSMGWTWTRTECSTVGCFAGWAEFFSGVGSDGGLRTDPCAHATKAQREAYDNLTMPPDWLKGHAKYTQDVCAIALRAYLTIGKADWSAIEAA